MKVYYNEYMMDGDQITDLDKLINEGKVKHKELENKQYTDVIMFDRELEDQVMDIFTM